MKVLLLSPLPPPVGGIASWTVNVLEYYSDKNEIEIIHQDTSIKFRRITNSGFVRRFFSGGIGAFVTLWGFIWGAIAFKPDVAHITSSGSLGLIRDFVICFAAKVLGIPVVIHFRYGRIPMVKEAKNWEWLLVKQVTTLCSHAIVLDVSTHSALVSSGFSNVSFVPNPIPKGLEELAVNNSQITDGELTDAKAKVLFVGHVTKEKGVFELVQACLNLHSILELIFVGPYETEIKDAILGFCTGSRVEVRFLGVLDKEEVLAQVRAAAMLVLPSYSEGFPNVVVEAMAMKCPVVATSVGAIPSILDADSESPCGLLVRPKDVKSLSDAIQKLISNRELAEKIGDNARCKVVSKYTLAKVCAQYESIWKCASKSRISNV